MNSTALKCALIMFIIVICLTGVGSQPLETFVACRGCLHPGGRCFESGVSYPRGGKPTQSKCSQHKGTWNMQMSDVHGYTAVPNTIVQSRNLVGLPSMFVTPGDPGACAAACNKHNLSSSHEKCRGFVYDGYPDLPEGTSPSPSLIKDQGTNPAHANKIICSFKGEYPSTSEKHNAYGSVFFKNNPSNITNPRPPNTITTPSSPLSSPPQAHLTTQSTTHHKQQIGSGSNVVGNYKGNPLPSNDNPSGSPLVSHHSINTPHPALANAPPQHLPLSTSKSPAHFTAKPHSGKHS